MLRAETTSFVYFKLLYVLKFLSDWSTSVTILTKQWICSQLVLSASFIVCLISFLYLCHSCCYQACSIHIIIPCNSGSSPKRCHPVIRYWGSPVEVRVRFFGRIRKRICDPRSCIWILRHQRNAKSEKGFFCHDMARNIYIRTIFLSYCPRIQLEWNPNNL